MGRRHGFLRHGGLLQRGMASSVFQWDGGSVGVCGRVCGALTCSHYVKTLALLVKQCSK